MCAYGCYDWKILSLNQSNYIVKVVFLVTLGYERKIHKNWIPKSDQNMHVKGLNSFLMISENLEYKG